MKNRRPPEPMGTATHIRIWMFKNSSIHRNSLSWIQTRLWIYLSIISNRPKKLAILKIKKRARKNNQIKSQSSTLQLDSSKWILKRTRLQKYSKSPSTWRCSIEVGPGRIREGNPNTCQTQIFCKILTLRRQIKAVLKMSLYRSSSKIKRTSRIKFSK